MTIEQFQDKEQFEIYEMVHFLFQLPMSFTVVKVVMEKFFFVHSQKFARSPDHLYH